MRAPTAVGSRRDNGRMTRSRDSAASAAIVAGVVAPVVSWGLTIAAGATWDAYDPVSQSISVLATAPHGWLQTLAFVVSGTLGVAWALGLSSVLGVTRRQRSVVRGLLVVQAGVALGFALLPTDPPGVPTSPIGALHQLDFYLYAVTMPLTLAVLGHVMRGDERWTMAVRPTFVAAGLVMLATALVPATINGPLTPWLGLLERVYVAVPSVWQVGAGIFSIRLVRGSSRGLRSGVTAP
jgi:hypothetical protein